jgi:hypothetical protein
MRKLRLIAASTAILAAAAGPVLTATHADATTTKQFTRILTSVDTHWVTPGDSAVITATLEKSGKALPDEDIKLFAREPGTHQGFSAQGVETTGDDGTAAFTVTPTRYTVYRIAFKGDATSRPSSSKRVGVWLQHDSKLAIASNSNGTIGGRLAGEGHPLPGRLVTLQSMGTDGWVDVSTLRTHRGGRVTFGMPGAGEYQLSFAGTKRYLPSTSPQVTLS